MASHQILIVEDEPDLRETVKEFLELEGFCVLAAANGREALSLLQDTGHSCLILLDLMMPVMNGWQFLETIKSDHQDILATTPIVITSAAADVTDVQRQYGCRVMKKPVNMRHLVELAHEYCE